MHELIGTCGTYVAIEGHITSWHLYDNNMFPIYGDDGMLNDTMTFFMLNMTFVPVLILVLASLSGANDDTNAIM